MGNDPKKVKNRCSKENLPIKSIHLLSTNDSVNAHNETVLNVLTTEGNRFIAIDSLVGDNAGDITDTLRSVLKHLKASDTQGLPYEPYLKLAARYLMTENNDIQVVWLMEQLELCRKYSIIPRAILSREFLVSSG